MGDRGTQVTPSQSDFLSQWEREMVHGLLNGRPFSSATVKNYVAYVTPFLSNYKTLSVHTLREALLSVPPEQFAKREKIYRALICFGKFLIEQKILEPEFLENVKKFVPKRHLPPKRNVVNPSELERLLKACDTLADSLLVVLLVYTGIRASEACQLKLSDIDFENGILTIRNGKWGRTRRVGLCQKVISLINAYLNANPKQQDEWLLLNRDGKQMDRHGLHRRLKRIGIKAEIKVNPHALRRAFVTINANRGRPLQMLQMACGHSDINTTRSYCMTTEDEVVEAMKNWY